MNAPATDPTFLVSIGVVARNEEARLPVTLASLLGQTLFARLAAQGGRAEIWCVANGCTDDTAGSANRVFRHAGRTHPQRAAFTARVRDLARPGKANAWNHFVHELSDSAARYLILMDADIRLHEPAALWNLVEALERDDRAQVAAGQPVKDIALKANPSLRERISLATSHMTRASGPQLTGQLYAIRADVARRIYLPGDVGCEDGFIKNVVCTDFLQGASDASRLLYVAGAPHVFEAYVSARDIIRNQKRQVINQTCLHVLLDQFLATARARPGFDLARIIRELEATDPAWFRRLVQVHVERVGRFWRLFPDVCTFRYRRWARLCGSRRLAHLPAMLVGSAVTGFAAWLAWRTLRRGEFGYWPGKTEPRPRQPAARPGLRTALST